MRFKGRFRGSKVEVLRVSHRKHLFCRHQRFSYFSATVSGVFDDDDDNNDDGDYDDYDAAATAVDDYGDDDGGNDDYDGDGIHVYSDYADDED